MYVRWLIDACTWHAYEASSWAQHAVSFVVSVFFLGVDGIHTVVGIRGARNGGVGRVRIPSFFNRFSVVCRVTPLSSSPETF